MRIIISILSVVMMFSIASSTVLAADFCETQAGQETEYCRDVAAAGGQGDNRLVGPNGIITQLTEAFSFFVGALSVIVIIIAGLRFILGGSNPESVAKARNTVAYAIAGVVIAVSAQLIVIFVLDRL